MAVIIIRDNELRKKIIAEAERLNISLDEYVSNVLKRSLMIKEFKEFFDECAKKVIILPSGKK